MKFLVQDLINNKKFSEVVENVKEKISPIAISGLSDVSKVNVISAILESTKRKICVVTYNEIQAKKLVKDLKYFFKHVYFFPKREIAPYDYIAESKDLPYERIAVLNKIVLQEKSREPIIIVTTIEAAMQSMISKEELYENIVDFKVGQSYSIEELKQTFVKLGYERNNLIEGQGQFSIRGGIVDVGLSDKVGVRIEFWGDEVDSIRYFKIDSQRSTEMIQNITIFPAHEFITNDVSKAIKKIEENYQNVDEDIELIKNGESISKIDKYFNEFYEKQDYFLDYLSEKYLIFIDENSKIEQRKENIVIENNNLIKSLVEKERTVPEAIKNVSNFEYDYSKKQIIYLEQNDIIKNILKFSFSTREINYYKAEIDLLISDLKEYAKKNKVIILGGNETTSQKVCELLKEREVNYKYSEEIKEVNLGDIVVTLGALSAGFQNYDLNLVVINLSNSFEETVKKKKYKNSAFKQGEKIVFADLKEGDYVVHKLHGIGQFMGVNTITTADKITKDYIKIKYRNDDVLYVPTDSLDNVRKYIGGGETSPKLNKLGTKEWENTKSKVKKNLEVIAKDLVELYAKRQHIKGFEFSKDTPWQKQFEDGFPYQETDDQLRCIEEVKKDMEKPVPMDRLLCGDVGYGKTEVAIRAAFKAVMDQKQVAYLVPTTVLANQQYEEFKSRMEEFPIRVDLLNRFRTKKEQEEVIKKLKLGELDVVIGTHRLLSKDVEFKDLGLLIIDEEQRFGVKDKEKIKQLKNSVDVLTMTATPIPRTLHMSILGVRDMSVIYEPPQNRRPVQTYVLEYDEEIVREAILKEVERGGQVFYLFNNVEQIAKKADDVAKLVPEAKVSYAHGKMSGKELEEIMEAFINKEIDVLVCTTILESGIDMPNANTIIVENAERLGLSQLYQIRGRVGRSNRQAYAYITYKRNKLLSEVADKRLKAIKEFTEFGSGFKIAMRDLEIRGAGSMLGEVQHGHMEQVGYDTYCKLLDEVMKETQGIQVQEEKDVQIDLNISSYIPDDFIKDSSQKIEIYQNIALCRTEEDIQNVIDEIIDRYGRMPDELENLIEIVRIKELARKSNIVKITQRMENVVFYFENSNYPENMINNLIQKYGNRIRFSTGVEPYITLKDVTNVIDDVKEFLHLVCERKVENNEELTESKIENQNK
mgnify:FL=1